MRHNGAAMAAVKNWDNGNYKNKKTVISMFVSVQLQYRPKK